MVILYWMGEHFVLQCACQFTHIGYRTRSGVSISVKGVLCKALYYQQGSICFIVDLCIYWVAWRHELLLIKKEEKETERYYRSINIYYWVLEFVYASPTLINWLHTWTCTPQHYRTSITMMALLYNGGCISVSIIAPC